MHACRKHTVKQEPEHQRLEVTIHWYGGVHTRIHVKKRPALIGNKTVPSLIEFVRELSDELSDAEIVRILNIKKQPTPKGLKWTLEFLDIAGEASRSYCRASQ